MAWIEYAQPAGIQLDVFVRFAKETKDLKADYDKDGDPIDDSKKKKVLNVIHGLPISRSQKNALYLCTDYDEDGLQDAPWN
jgi:hypothetical protein